MSPMRRAPCLLVLLAAASASACRVTTTERLARPEAVHVEHGSAARSWNVRAGGAVIGRVVLFEAEERPEAPVFMVQNEVGQDLGMIDGLGRAWRYRPHQRDAEWVGTGTVSEGAALILGAETCLLEEIPLAEALEAAQTR
jgi:hypothetical protein